MDVTNEEHTNEVLRGLNDMRERAELTDAVLEVEGRSFPCHRAVLASCSPYFRTMFTSGYAETKQERISIQDVSEVAMATILDYAYTGRLRTEPDQVQAVMSAARLLQIDFVCGKAAEYMKDKLDVSNCADVLMYADMLGDSALVEASGRYIASRFKQVVLQPSFLQLSLPLLQSLLNRDDLITSEDNVVRAAQRWIEFDKEERLQHLPALCRCFRHSFISSDQLAEIESKCPSTDCTLVYSDITTQRLGQVRTEMQIFLRENYSGYDENSRRTAPCYDPSAGKRYVIKMPRSLENFSVTTTPDDELYLAGGAVTSSEYVVTRQKTFYQYNHLFNTWEPRCEMIAQRVRCGLVYLKGYIYAIGGDREITTAEWTAERYDPSRDEWTSIPPPPQPVFSELCAVTLDDSIYVISQEGCFSFSTTKNTWNKIQNMLNPAVRPQAVTYQGRIYCMDCFNDDCGYYASPYIAVYTPTNDGGYWFLTGKRSVTFDKATMMKYGDTVYLFILINDHENRHQCKMYYVQYRPETESWRYLKNKGRMRVPSMANWMDSGSWIDCVTARMIPTCLGDDDFEYRIIDVCRPSDDEDESGSAFSSSESSGSEIIDDSHCEDDVSDQEDNDEDNNDNDRGSGSDSGDI